MHLTAQLKKFPALLHAAAGLQGVFQQVAEDDAQISVGYPLQPLGEIQTDLHVQDLPLTPGGVVGDHRVHCRVFAVSPGDSGNGVQQGGDKLLQLFRVGIRHLLDGGQLVAQVVALPPQLGLMLQHQPAVFLLLIHLQFQKMGLKIQLLLKNSLFPDPLQGLDQHPVDHHHTQQ